jgi:predicted TIM-barrel fold metal-dependent hydrolase
MSERIDGWTHILPPAYLARLRRHHPETGRLKRWLTMTTLFDLDARFRLMDRFAPYRQLLTLSMPPIEELVPAGEAAETARIANDGLAALAAGHPDRFVGWVASLSLLDPDAAIREAQRAASLGARGVQIPTHILGRPLDDPDFVPVFDAIAALGWAIWLHPVRGPDVPDYRGETASRHEIWWCFGWPYDSSAAMARLVFSGLFDRHPGLRVVTHHMGAMIPYFAGRIRQGWGRDMGSRTPSAEASLLGPRLAREPIAYFREFFADTALSGEVGAMRCGLDFFGAQRVMFASDFPFDAEGGAYLVRETLAGLDALGLDAAARAQVMHGTLAALLVPQRAP